MLASSCDVDWSCPVLQVLNVAYATVAGLCTFIGATGYYMYGDCCKGPHHLQSAGGVCDTLPWMHVRSLSVACRQHETAGVHQHAFVPEDALFLAHALTPCKARWLLPCASLALRSPDCQPSMPSGQLTSLPAMCRVCWLPSARVSSW